MLKQYREQNISHLALTELGLSYSGYIEVLIDSKLRPNRTPIQE
jgi:hypothetical protein